MRVATLKHRHARRSAWPFLEMSLNLRRRLVFSTTALCRRGHYLYANIALGHDGRFSLVGALDGNGGLSALDRQRLD